MSIKGKDIKISYWAAHLTTVVSVTMVLILVGAICLLGFAASNTATRVKQQQQVSLVMQDSVSNEQASKLSDYLKTRPFVNSISVITKEQALADWNASTGDDVEEIAGYNFFSPEIELTLTAGYTVPDSVKKVEKILAAMPGVQEAVIPDTETITSMDAFFSRTLLLLGGVALAMIAISFVLINNTVLLTIYSRRFTIHTMQLVGATPGFIRRPFIGSNLLAGAISGVIAAVILASAVSFVESTQIPELRNYITPGETVTVCVCLVAVGAALCSLSAFIATNRYLHKNYDDLFT